MKTHNTKQNMKCAICSGSLSLMLASIIAAAVLLFPTDARSQPSEWIIYNTDNSGIPENRVVAIGIDTQGNVWTAHSSAYGIGSGCARFDGENWTVYKTDNSGLPHDNANAFAFDQQGNVWIGTGSTHSTGGGLAKFDGTNWTTYNKANSGLPHDNISHLTFGPEGNLWIGTYGGIAKFYGEKWTTYSTANSGLPSNIVTGFSFDTLGNLWIGTWGGGLAKFNGENWTVYNKSNSGLPSNRIVPVAVDPQDNIWIGTFEGASGGDRGLVKFNGENWTIYNTENSGLPANGIWALAVDGHGNVWAGPTTDNPPVAGGLTKFDGKNWTIYNTSNSGLPDNSVHFLTIDAQGNVWIGTKSVGLAVYRPLPAVDFNGDEIVDIHDLLILIEHWGTDEPLCDIVPMPWGDGIIDVKDLEVLMCYWQQEFLPVSLLTYWKLDETEGPFAADSAGQHDGTLHGEPLWQPTAGAVDGALEFDGIDDYVSTEFVLNPADGEFSVFAWIKGVSTGQVVIAQKDGVNWLCADTLEGNLMTELKATGRGAAAMLSQTNITDGNWHRVGFVWDGAYRALYVDDILVAEDTQTGLASSVGGLKIGCGSGPTAGTFFSGLIDDVRIYNRAVSP